MKKLLMTLAHICSDLSWWFAEKAGEVRTQTQENGAIIKSWSYE